MRTTLRRSCDACAKAKHGCDLKTPKCSRCLKRNKPCVYANAPGARIPQVSLLATATVKQASPPRLPSPSSSDTTTDSAVVGLRSPDDASLDPFDSYPATRVARPQVQRLIHHFLSSVAFQYYPLDMSMKSNPFVVSWWPRALADPALFHVSLQTASLDQERRAQEGFPISEVLMVDSVMLLRQKIANPALAFQDETLNAVVTLAAIEHGKGNYEASKAHVDGIKRIVNVRGGIHEVKRISPLTARMISWVSMLVTGAPQFATQDDDGHGDGVDPIAQWRMASLNVSDAPGMAFTDLDLDPVMNNILTRLRSIFYQGALSTTELHDLTCFVVHKLLLLPPFLPANTPRSLVSECFRYAMVLYMLVIHGTTYYPNEHLMTKILIKLKEHFTALVSKDDRDHSALKFWILLVSMVAASWTPACDLFMSQAHEAAQNMGIESWDDVVDRLESVLWLRSQQDELFRRSWDRVRDMPSDRLYDHPCLPNEAGPRAVG